MKRLQQLLTVLAGLALGCATIPAPVRYDAVIRNGLIYDGNGGEPFNADLAINADTIAFIGDLKNASAKNPSSYSKVVWHTGP